MFVLKSLTIRRRNYYSSDPALMGPLEGEMELRSDKSNLQFNLSPEQTQRILEIVAEAVTDSAKECAKIMVSQVSSQIEGTELLGNA